MESRYPVNIWPGFEVSGQKMFFTERTPAVTVVTAYENHRHACEQGIFRLPHIDKKSGRHGQRNRRQQLIADSEQRPDRRNSPGVDQVSPSRHHAKRRDQIARHPRSVGKASCAPAPATLA